MRKSGILMHITSLPGPYGIGTMGRSAFDFVDFLASSGQRCWQLLPLNPTGFGDSPYQSCSAYAGNHYLIDLDALVADGLLTEEDLSGIDWCGSETRVDFGKQYNYKLKVLRKAYARFTGGKDFDAFLLENQAWLPDYALFMALKDSHHGAAWYTWEDGLKFRKPEALAAARTRLAGDIRFYSFVQFLFFRQWTALRKYAHSKDIEIIGDVPIYVPYDSVEIWTQPELFQMNEDRSPKAVSGCPPDFFSEDGQLWGNPVYDWDQMKKQNFDWWVRRLAAAGKLYDVIRLDHFRGFEAFWSVPYGDKTARNGKWVPGPGMDFIRTLKQELPQLSFIAEDLGFLTEEVLNLRERSGYPGMKILGFAFDSRNPSEYTPHVYTSNTVCYTGTHDNMTTMQWFDNASDEAIAYITEYMGLEDVAGIISKEALTWAVIRMGMSSVSDLFIAQMQDYLLLGEESRMNYPGTLSGDNWTWRAKPGFTNEKLAKRIRAMAEIYGHCAPKREPVKETETNTILRDPA